MAFAKRDFQSIHVVAGCTYAEYSGECEESKLRLLKEYGFKDHKAYVGEGAPTLSTRLTFADRNGDRFIHLLPRGQERAEVNQLLDYYPFGLAHGGTTCRPEMENENAYRYNGMEYMEEAEMYTAFYRSYDPAIGRWNAVDPLAGDYASLSPYNYVANNPLRFIDPDGMRIGEGKDVFQRFRNGVKDKIKTYNTDAQNFQTESEAALADGRTGKANRLAKRADKARGKASAYTEVLNELNTLESSDQLYNINISSSDIRPGAGGNLIYDLETDAVNVNIVDSYNAGALAHELKHTYQFETGALSFSSNGRSGGSLYDLQDEVEAYARGSLFGYPLNPSLEEIKRDYPAISSRESQETLNSLDGPFVGSATRLQQMSARTSQAAKAGRPAPEYYRNWRNYYE